MENLEYYLSFAGTIIGFSVTVITLIMKLSKSAKAKKIAEQTLKIGEAMLPFIEEAEKFVSYTGEEKKTYVMTKANQFAIESKISFNQNLVSDKIEELMELTKKVNARNKTK